ncbi:hypothetical protein ACHQM5_011347 [Ranunculus cassubicifolius]
MQKVSDLPDDIIEVILLLLSSKHLGRFKSVSKSWNTLISSNEFTVKRGAKKIMLRIRHPDLYAIADYDKFDEALDMRVDDMGEIWNSCYGLLLAEDGPRVYPGMVSNPTFFIWNPTTGGRLQLPKPLTEVRGGMASEILYGLGYDHISGYYKVLRILYYREEWFEDGCPPDDDWSLYTQQTNSWQRFETIVPYKPDPHSYQMVYLENALHMVANTLTSRTNKGRVILAFDLSSEEFREVPQPDHGDEKFCIDVNASYRWLTLVSHLGGPVFNVWAMKEYGKRESWIKMFSINQSTIMRSRESLFPLHLSENGVIIASVGGYYMDKHTYLVFCDSLRKEARIFKPPRASRLEIAMFVESLVTFNIDENLVKQENKEFGKENLNSFRVRIVKGKDEDERQPADNPLNCDYFFTTSDTISGSATV